MGVLADKIEQFILTKLLEEQEGITLRRNELAAILDCAPSQISYVLSTRFSNDRGFIVESRRGLGGSITISRIVQPIEVTPKIPTVSINDIDAVLFQHMKDQLITKREAAMLHEAFQGILEDVPPRKRHEAAERLYQAVMKIAKEEV